MFKIIKSVTPVFACPPSFRKSFTEVRRFEWNVETAISITMDFEYEVGEGPLYWFRIEWHHRVCSITCSETQPIISYIASNCPYEIIENCLVLPPQCHQCSCVPCSKIEIWHMLATSTRHLCERINQECCNAKPQRNYFITKVQQYGRPALCCDVEAHGVNDEYVDVNFINCECGNLVDPCLAQVIYPCHINRCGINGPVFQGGNEPPISIIKLAPDILGHFPIAIADNVFAIPEIVEILPPAATVKKQNKITNRFGPLIPELIHCNHNLAETNLFGSYLKNNNLSFNQVNLFYNKDRDSWRGSNTFNTWRCFIDWNPVKDGYRFSFSIEKNNLKTKILLAIKTDSILDKQGNFFVDLDFNTSVKDSRILTFSDELGLFKGNWRGKLKLILKG